MEHPGGPEILFASAGKDATEEFEETFHSENARELTRDLIKGRLKGYEGSHDIWNTDGSSTGGGNGQQMFMLIPIIVIILAVVYNFAM